MKVSFLWTNISGYMAACWRALDARDNVDVSVCALRPSKTAPFSPETVIGLEYRLLDSEERDNPKEWRRFIDSAKADVYVICGWGPSAFPGLAKYIRARGSKVIVVLDTPFEGRWQQYLTRFRYRQLFSNNDMFVVTGERAYQYAVRLGSRTPIRRGLYGVDYDRLSGAYLKRLGEKWPRKFLFVGRYSKVKNIDLLVDAYVKYRNSVDEPWSLICCGTGPEAASLNDVPGIVDRGFCQPDEIAEIMAETGAFVLPSRFDPWPLVIVEACASGLPIVCSQACGSAVENVRDYYNGVFVETGSVGEFAEGLIWMHHNYEKLPEWGLRSQEEAKAYSADAWATRWTEWLKYLNKSKS